MSRNSSAERGKLVGHSVKKAQQKQFCCLAKSYCYLHEMYLTCRHVDKLGKQCRREDGSLLRASMF